MQSITPFPAQKIPSSKRTKEWYKQCIDTAVDIVSTQDSHQIRSSIYNKKINYDLINGVIHDSDVEKAFNPMGIKGYSMPGKMQNYPIELSKFMQLKGEELERRFDWRVRVINEDSISEKEESVKKLINEEFIRIIQGEEQTEGEISKRIKRLQSYIKYDYQSLREIDATNTLRYLERSLKTKESFNRAFWDVLVAAEEIYSIDIYNNEPTCEKEDPLTVYALGTKSYKIEDSDIIIIDDYIPIGRAIDYYYDYLTPDEVDVLETGKMSVFKGGKVDLGYTNVSSSYAIPYTMDNNTQIVVPVNPMQSMLYGGSFDTNGNVRRVRVRWLGRRLVQIVSVMNEEGELEEDIRDDKYTLGEGETLVKKVWINEWLEGTRLADNIYVKTGVREQQFREMNNISACKPGIVGTLYNINSNVSISLMDRVKPYKYLYNILMRRIEIAWSKFKGPMITLDISKFPDNDFDKWMHYAEATGFLFKDSTREIDKGLSKGKLVGDMSNGDYNVLNSDMGNYIQQHISMLQYYEQQISSITGISRQREGSISSQETVGGVQAAIGQSAYITEEWFYLHDNTKIRVYEALLDTAKTAWKGTNKKLQYITDDLTQVLWDIDSDRFLTSEFGVFVSNTINDQILFKRLDQLSQAALQNDKLSFSQVMSIYSDESISAIRRKIEEGEEEQIQSMQEQQKQQEAMRQEAIAFEREKLDRADNLEYAKIESKERIEAMKLQDPLRDMDNDNVPDIIEFEKERTKERIANIKANADERLKKMQLEHDAKQNEKKLKIEEKKISKAKPTKK